jgi:hypothetical protein
MFGNRFDDTLGGKFKTLLDGDASKAKITAALDELKASGLYIKWMSGSTIEHHSQSGQRLNRASASANVWITLRLCSLNSSSPVVRRSVQ